MARVNEGSHSFTCHPHVSPSVMSCTCIYSRATEHRHTLAGTRFLFHWACKAESISGMGSLVRCRYSQCHYHCAKLPQHELNCPLD